MDFAIRGKVNSVSRAIHQHTHITKPRLQPVRHAEGPAEPEAQIFGDKTWIRNPDIDPRDVKMQFPIEEILKQIDQDWSEDQQNLIRDWLVLVLQSVLSDGFMKLQRKQLTQQQTKAYAAKNITYNIYLLMHKLSKKLDETARQAIMKFINEEMKVITGEILQKYPQALGKASVRKLKGAITRPDNRQSNEFDLFRFPSKTNVRFQYQEDGDYSSEIMRALNYMIDIDNSQFSPKCQSLTNFECFQVLLEFIFTLAGDCTFEQRFMKGYSLYAANLDSFTQENLQRILQKDDYTLTEEQKKKYDEFRERLAEKSSTGGEPLDSLKQETKKVVSDKAKTGQRSYKISHKIAVNVQNFTEEQILSGKFRVPDVSVLRIMTKWAEQLREYLGDARHTLLKRVQLFKTHEGQLVDLEPVHRYHLFKAAVEEEKRIDEIYKQLKEDCTNLETKLASKYYRGKYTNTADVNLGMFAAMNQDAIGQYTFLYLNQLIHSLLVIPHNAKISFLKQCKDKEHEAEIFDDINLITFKTGDLMRARCKAAEKDIIMVYKFMEKVSQNCPKLLKIVRLKDRLDNKDKDILINFFFAQRIQCEVQLSVATSISEKEVNYNGFNHFIYELARAEFGPIAECSCILAYYDPMIRTYSRKQSLGPETMTPKEHKAQKLTNQQQKRLIESTKTHPTNNFGLPFFCTNCARFSKALNNEFYTGRIHCSSFIECQTCYEVRMLSTTQKQKELIQQLFRQHMDVNSTEMKSILDHYKMLKNTEIKDPAGQLFGDFCQGIIIMKGTKRPYPQYFKAVNLETDIHIVVQNQHKNTGSKILLTFDKYASNQKIFRQFEKAFFLVGKHTSEKNIVMKQAQIENYDIGTQQSQEGHKFECLFLCCKKCGIKDLFLSRQFKAKEDIIFHLNHNKIMELNKQLKEVIYLANKSVTRELQTIPPMKCVKRCYVQENQIEQISYENLQNVTKLDIESNRIKTMKNLKLIKNLKDLRCGSNGLRELIGIDECKTLEVLHIDNNMLANLDFMKNLPQIRTLNCSNNPLSDLSGLENSTNLQMLYCSNHKNRESLSHLHNCKRLRLLDTNDCKVKSLKDLAALTNLEQLFVENNEVTSIEGLQTLTKLKVLKLCHNKLTSIAQLAKNSQLETLSISHNQLESTEGLQSLILLTRLSVGYNAKISKLNIPKLIKNLKELNISGTSITSFEEIKKAKRLQTLKISQLKGQIRSLEGISSLKQLKTLQCNGLGLTSLKALRCLVKLEKLTCSDNDLKSFNGIENLKNLANIDCSGNPIKKETLKELRKFKKHRSIILDQIDSS